MGLRSWLRRTSFAWDVRSAKRRDLLDRLIASPFAEADYVAANLPADRDEAASFYFSAEPGEGAVLGPFFSPRYYASKYAGDMIPGGFELHHYLKVGFYAGYQPFPLIDPSFIREELAMKGMTAAWTPRAMVDAIRNNVVAPHPLFDFEHLTAYNADYAAGDVCILKHFIENGAAERRTPNPYFEYAYYAAAATNAPADPLSMLFHFVNEGDPNGISPSDRFDGAGYLRNNSDVAAVGMGALTHYLRSGRREGRPAHYVEPEKTVLAAAPTRPALSAYRRPYEDAAQRLTGACRAPIEAFRESPVVFDYPKASAKARFIRPDAPAVSVIIPVYGKLDLLTAALDSLLKAGDAADFEVIVADDHGPESVDTILMAYPGVRFIRRKANLGFLRNCNEAAKEARGDWLLFLNSDVVVGPQTLDRLLAAASEEPDVLVAGPKILYPNGRLQEAGCALRPDATGAMVGLFEPGDAPGFAGRREVDYVSGACLLVQRAFFESVGGFRDALAPAYAEDADLCLAARNAGGRVVYVPEAVVTHALSQSHDAVDPHYKTVRSITNQQKVMEAWADRLEADGVVRTYAFYLPQFHRTRENDLWWSKGFTEWTNASRATPKFDGHRQPRLPADLGFYDLSDPKVMGEQAALARRYGIDGFAVYYYNFGGRRILETPIETLLKHPEIDFPFFLCWANENWSRRWDGGDNEPLLTQPRTKKAEAEVAEDVARHFEDPRYIRFEGRPVFMVYRSGDLVDAPAFAAALANACRKRRLPPPFLITVEAMEQASEPIPTATLGFDAACEFAPHGYGEPVPTPDGAREFAGQVYGYEQSLALLAGKPRRDGLWYRCAFPNWDNTPRRARDGNVFAGATPGGFRAHLDWLIEDARHRLPPGRRAIFINAWNEWAEGAILEPDHVSGHAWLEAVRNARIDAGQFL